MGLEGNDQRKRKKPDCTLVNRAWFFTLLLRTRGEFAEGVNDVGYQEAHEGYPDQRDADRRHPGARVCAVPAETEKNQAGQSRDISRNPRDEV